MNEISNLNKLIDQPNLKHCPGYLKLRHWPVGSVGLKITLSRIALGVRRPEAGASDVSKNV